MAEMQSFGLDEIPLDLRGKVLYGDELLKDDDALQTLLKAVFYGSVDPFQRGHESLCQRGQEDYCGASGKHLVIAIVRSFYKTHLTNNPPMFSLEERAHLIRTGYPHLQEMLIVLCKPAGVRDEDIGPRDELMNAAIDAYAQNRQEEDPENKLSQTEGAIDVNEVVTHMLDVYAKESGTQLSFLKNNTFLVNALRTWVTVRWMKCRSQNIIKGVRAEGDDLLDFLGSQDHNHTQDLFQKYLLPEKVQNRFREYDSPQALVDVSSRKVKQLVQSGRLEEATSISSEPVALAVNKRIHEIINSGEHLADFVILNGVMRRVQKIGRGVLRRMRNIVQSEAVSS